MKNVIITGPTGAIGMALIERLLQAGCQITAVCHRGSKRIGQIPKLPQVRIIECDLEELDVLPNLVKEPQDVFYHFAWGGTTGAARNDTEIQMKNMKAALAAVEAAGTLGCQCFVGAGSQAEYGRYEGSLNASVATFPENGYGMAKLCAGQMTRLRCKQLGIRHIWTRILSVYGPYDGEGSLISGLIRQFLRGEKPSCTKGEQIWDYIYSKDAAEALYRVAKNGKDGKIYCIGSGRGKPLKEYICEVRDAIDPSLSIGFGEVPYGEKQVMHLVADISELEKDTGFEPEYSFEQGIREMIENKQER
ncbi:MAG: NAD-dependent epimerase/dehydratase family protein [Lachnospiraceae bacterium]